MDKMFVSKSAKYSPCPFAVIVHNELELPVARLIIAQGVYCLVRKSACDCYSSYFSVSSNNCRLKSFTAYLTPGIQQIRLYKHSLEK